jgi:hypothetical protein
VPHFDLPQKFYQGPPELPIGVAAGTSTGTQGTEYGSSRGLRNNNPLNLEFVPGQRGLDPNSPSDGRFGRYSTIEEGIAQATRQFLLYQDRDGLKTIRGMIGKWTPAGEAGNHTAAEIDRLSSALNIGPDTPFSMHDPDKAAAFERAVAGEETGKAIDRAVFDRGVAMALGLQAPSPLPDTAAAAPAFDRSALDAAAMKAPIAPETTKPEGPNAPQRDLASLAEMIAHSITEAMQNFSHTTNVHVDGDRVASAVNRTFDRSIGGPRRGTNYDDSYANYTAAGAMPAVIP